MKPKTIYESEGENLMRMPDDVCLHCGGRLVLERIIRGPRKGATYWRHHRALIDPTTQRKCDNPFKRFPRG